MKGGKEYMTEQRFHIINDVGNLKKYGIICKPVVVDNETDKKYILALDLLDLLNALHEENNNLKQALWEAETEYIHERYYDNPIRKEESINELKEDFKRGYWND